MHNPNATENLFSYGTLQREAVQTATFQRLLQGAPDLLPGFILDQVAIDDAQVVSTSGAAYHPIAKHTGNPVEQVKGTVFRITADELALADGYEVAAYQRVSVTLASGVQAWVYGHAPELKNFKGLDSKA